MFDLSTNILNSLPENVAVIRTDGFIEFVNLSWLKFSESNNGNSSHTGVGANYFDVCKHAGVSGENILSGLKKIVSGEKKFFSAEYPCHSQDEDRWFLMLAKKVEECPSHFVISHVNITERKKLEIKNKYYATDLERSNQNLKEFTFIASHDLKEPLRKVINSAEFLKEKTTNLDEECNNYIDIMRDASIRMNTLIDDLLELANVDAKEKSFDRHNLTKIAQDSLNNLDSRLKRTKGKVNINNLPSIEVDSSQMLQLFQNLIGNALKYHREGISPVINVYSQSSENGSIEVAIEDNGIGLNEKYAEKIFQPFQRLHGKNAYEGNGIGLTICRKIIDRHNGTIIFKKSSGEGSTFVITLPEKQANH
jgi:signal transduction histidine kinase